MDSESIKEIELRYKIAEAKFGVADELAWATAIFASAAAYLRLGVMDRGYRIWSGGIYSRDI